MTDDKMREKVAKLALEMDLTKLQALKARVDAASGPDWRIDMDVENVFGEWEHLGGHWKRHKVTGARVRGVDGPSPPVSASIDAAVSLTERVLPDEWPSIIRAAINELSSRFRWATDFPREGQKDMLPLAVLSALLAALIAQEQAPPCSPEGEA